MWEVVQHQAGRGNGPQVLDGGGGGEGRLLPCIGELPFDEPAALIQRLRMGVDGSHVAGGHAGPHDEAEFDGQDQLTANGELRFVDEDIQRAGDGAIQAVLDGEHAFVGVARLDGGGDGGLAGEREVLRGGVIAQGRLLAKRAGRAQVSQAAHGCVRSSVRAGAR